jgi:hypothetical protein
MRWSYFVGEDLRGRLILLSFFLISGFFFIYISDLLFLCFEGFDLDIQMEGGNVSNDRRMEVSFKMHGAHLVTSHNKDHEK